MHRRTPKYSFGSELKMQVMRTIEANKNPSPAHYTPINPQLRRSVMTTFPKSKRTPVKTDVSPGPANYKIPTLVGNYTKYN